MFDKTGVHLVDLLLQLLLIAPTESFTAHLLDGTELTDAALLQVAVTALQVSGGDVGFVSSAYLRTRDKHLITGRADRAEISV